MKSCECSVLILEEDASRRFLMRHALHKRGFQVFAARSKCEAANVLVEASPPNVLITRDREGSYRLTLLPNSSASKHSARLAGLTVLAKLAGPLTPARLADELFRALEARALHVDSLTLSDDPKVPYLPPIAGENAA